MRDRGEREGERGGREKEREKGGGGSMKNVVIVRNKGREEHRLRRCSIERKMIEKVSVILKGERE